MPLRNRVDPFGAIQAVPARGLIYGNRGGRFHRDDRTLKTRPWASPQWLCCVLDFKNRRRAPLMGRGYTELFFLDEVTALAAGHRPCFECRRTAATAFAAAWAKAKGLTVPPKAPAMDIALHAERLAGTVVRLPLESLPEGAMIAAGDRALAVRGAHLLPWSFAGYGPAEPRGTGPATVLTPPSTLAALGAGYRPIWHPTADA